jgi:hypothetical protein
MQDMFKYPKKITRHKIRLRFLEIPAYEELAQSVYELELSEFEREKAES